MVDHFHSPVIEAHHLAKDVMGPRGALQILEDVNLRVNGGEAVAILGVSGAGKSTLLGLLAGLDTPSRGQARLFGKDLGGLDEDGRAALRAGQVGFVFQSFQLLPAMTALENVMLPLELGGNGRAARAMAKQSLERVGLPTRADHYPHQLSGGEQQRVAIARAFVSHPQVLFVDEPTGNLDQTTGHRVIELMFTLRDENLATMVMVTHDKELTVHCDHRYRLQAGTLEVV
jgi:putative ABC transport system ATP-binding protein